MHRHEIKEVLGIFTISSYVGNTNSSINFHYKNGDYVSISILDDSYNNINKVIDDYLIAELSKVRETKINYLLND